MADEDKTEADVPAAAEAEAAAEAAPEEVVAEAVPEASAEAEDEPAAAPEPEPEPAPAAKPKRAPRTTAKKAAEPVEEEREEPSARAPRGVKPKRKAPVQKKPKTAAERGTYVRTARGEHPQGQRKERRGVVTSDRGEKTITLRVDVMISHPKYKKIMRRSIKLHAHDERNEAKVGDVVRVVECRPLSKTKRWRLVEIVEVAR
jgi:small subunit ribosomal protein S17